MEMPGPSLPLWVVLGQVGRLAERAAHERRAAVDGHVAGGGALTLWQKNRICAS